MHSTIHHNKKLDTIQVSVPCVKVHAGSFANQVEFDPLSLPWTPHDLRFTVAQFLFDSFVLVNYSEPSATFVEFLLGPSYLGEVEYVAGNVPASCWNWRWSWC